MKKMPVLMVVLSSLILNSCVHNYQAIIKPENKPDDMVISPELKAFLRNTPNPAIVLRVPYTTSVVTEAEHKTLAAYNNAYNQIEKNLMKAGFVVRDRGLLNNLLSTGQTDYSEIGRKIQTDLILEIQSIDFAIENRMDSVIDKETGRTLHLTDSCYVDPMYAKMECKIVIVDKGQTAAVLSLYFQSCTKGCDVEVYNNGMSLAGRDYLPSVRPPGDERWHRAYQINPALTEESAKLLIEYFSLKLARVLRGELQ
jgi:hypothetical protein